MPSVYKYRKTDPRQTCRSYRKYSRIWHAQARLFPKLRYMAPAEDPQIAVAVMIAQGGAAANAAPIAKEVMGAYFQQQENK